MGGDQLTHLKANMRLEPIGRYIVVEPIEKQLSFAVSNNTQLSLPKYGRVRAVPYSMQVRYGLIGGELILFCPTDSVLVGNNLIAVHIDNVVVKFTDDAYEAVAE